MPKIYSVFSDGIIAVPDPEADALANSVFSIVSVLHIMARMLIALRDYVKPEVVDE
jgi:hypothetical protein